MGIAIIIPDVDFSNDNLGQISFSDDLVSISIGNVTQGEEITGATHQFNVLYNPATTTPGQKGVAWSITSGSQYASIDNNGLMTIDPSANQSAVTVKATSTYDQTIYAEVNILVTFQLGTLAVFTDTAMYNLNYGTYSGPTMQLDWHTTDGIDVSGATNFVYLTTESTPHDGKYSGILFFSTTDVHTTAMGPGVNASSNGVFTVPVPAGAVRAVIMNHGTTDGVRYSVETSTSNNSSSHTETTDNGSGDI